MVDTELSQLRTFTEVRVTSRTSPSRLLAADSIQSPRLSILLAVSCTDATRPSIVS